MKKNKCNVKDLKTIFFFIYLHFQTEINNKPNKYNIYSVRNCLKNT